MTTPLHWSLLPSRGEDSATVISVHSLKGVGLRNSMPLLWTETASAKSSKRDWRPSTVTCCFGESMLSIFLALINQIQNNTPRPIVKCAGAINSPLDDRRTPRQAGAKNDQQDQIAALDFA